MQNLALFILILLSACKLNNGSSAAQPENKNIDTQAFCRMSSNSYQQTSAFPQARLTTLTVTLNTDNNPGGFGDVGELRYALNTLNQELNTTPDDYVILFAFPMTIQLNGNLPIINNSSNSVNITIGNSGPTPTVTIDGNNGAYSGFLIPMGNVTVQNIIFQNLAAKGGNGGDGISGGGGGLGAGGAIFAPQTFLNGTNPAVTLANVQINNCSAVGGNGGSFFELAFTGNEGGGGGGGFGGNGGSITTTGSTGGAGGGGFGGNGGDATLSTDLLGGGGGGGGGIGSRATIGTLTNLGNGGSDQNVGTNGNAYGLTITAGSGGGGFAGGNNAGGGGGGGDIGGNGLSGGGGGGSSGTNGLQPQGSIPPFIHNLLLSKGGSATPSGGSGGDGGGGGGGAIVIAGPSNQVDGRAANGGYFGGGGGGAGTGAYDFNYSVEGGSGGVGGGGGGGGVNLSGTTSANGGNSLGGGGGAGGGPSDGLNANGGTDIGNLGGGSGGAGANTYGSGGGGGGGGSGLGGAIFVDSNLNFTVQALDGVPTTFNTSNNTTQAGTHGTGAPGASDGTDGSALGNSIFLRAGSSLRFRAQGANDILTLGDQVAFTDDTTFGGGGTVVFVSGNGTVIYQGTTDYQGTVQIQDATFKVEGQIDQATIYVGVCATNGTLSGNGTLTGDVYVDTGTISPDSGETLSLGTLTLNSGSTVHVRAANSIVTVTGNASLAGNVRVDPSLTAGDYTILTAGNITGAFNPTVLGGNIGYRYELNNIGNSIQLSVSENTTVASRGGSGCSLGTPSTWLAGTVGAKDNKQPKDFLFLLAGMYMLLLVVETLRRKIKEAYAGH